MAFNRELSQFASFLELDASSRYIGITSNSASTKVGVGTATPDSKFVVVGDARITGIVTAAGFSGPVTGEITGNVTGNVTGNLTGEVNAAAFDTNASGVVVTGVATATSGFSGNLTGNVTGDVTGNSSTATALQTARTFQLTGDVASAAVSFDGTGNVSIAATIQPNSVALGTDTTGNYVATVADAGSSDIVVNNSGTETAAVTIGLTTTGVVAGSYGSTTSIPTITVDSRGRVTSVGTASVGTALTVAGNSGSENINLLTETLSIVGAAGSVATSAASNTITVDLVNTAVTPGSYGSSTQIPTFTVDAKGRLTAAGTASVGTALTVAGDSGSENIDLLSETLTISGGTNLTSSAAANGVTINLDPSIDLTSVKASGIITAAQFVTGASGQAIGINTSTISGPAEIIIDPAGVGDNTGAVRIKGDLFVDGVQTVINSTTIELADFIVGIASTATTDALADGAGIKIGPDNTLTYDNANTALKSSENFNLASGKSYKINGTEVLSATSLSITNVNASGVVTATNGFSGNLSGNVTGNVTGNLTGEVNAAAFDTNASGVVVTGVTTSTSFSGPLTGNVTGNVTGNLTGEVNAAAFDTNASGVVVTGVATATSGFSGNLTGNADTATTLQTARDFQVTGDASSAAVSFNGSGNVGLAITLANTAVTAGSYGSSTQIPTFTVDSKGRLTAAGTASVGAALTVTGDSGSETINFLNESLSISGGTNLTSSAASNAVTINLDPNISLTSVVASGVVTATSGFSGNLTGNVTGNADTATALQTARTFQLTGDVASAAVSFDGTGNVGLAVTIQPNSVALGTDTTGNYVATVADAGSSDIVVSNSGSETAAVTLGLSTTGVTAGSYGSSTQIPTFTVDSRGRLTAAGTASVGTALTVAGDSGSENINLLSETLTISGGTNLTSSAASNSVTINLDNDISLTSVVASGVITATSGFSGNLTGEVNAAAFDTNASGVVVTGVATATSGFSGNLTGNVTGDVTGNSSTATALQTARTFQLTGDVASAAVSFDGTGNVSIAATIQPNSVALGTDTTGNYVATVADAGSSDIVVSNSGSENAAVTLGLSTTGVTAGSYGSSTQIPTFTVDSRGRLTVAGVAAVGTALTVAGDSGSENINLLTETLTISGGTNLNSSASGNSVTVNLDPAIDLTSVKASGIITAAQFVTGASGEAIGINTNTITGPAELTIDPAAVGDNTGLVRIKGDLYVDGSQFFVNSTTIELADFVVGVASTAASNAVLDGAGIGIGSANIRKTITWNNTSASLKSSENFDLASGKVYKINGTEVLSANSLSIANVNASGIVTATGGFIGSVTGNVTGNLTGNADTATTLQTARNFQVTGDASSAAVSFNGSANVGLAITLANTAVTAGSYGSSTQIPTFTVDSKGRLTAAGTAAVGTALTVAGDSGTETINLLSETFTVTGGTNLTSSAASNAVTIDLDPNISLTSVVASGVVTATSGFSGNLTGNVTGNVAGNLTGNVNATSGISTFNNIDINGTLTDVNNSTGTSGYVLKNVGTGVSWASISDSLPTLRTTSVQTATSGQTSFTVNYTVGFLDVFINGVKLAPSEFTANNGTGVTLSEAAFAGDVVEFYAYNTLSAGVGSVNSLNDLSDVTLTSSSNGQLLQYNGSEWVNSSALVGINSVDATTVATLETALGYAPNTFNSLLISNSGVSTFTGSVLAQSGVKISGGIGNTSLIVEGDARITGILTIGTSSIVLDGSQNQVNVGTGVTLHHTNGVQVGSNNLHSTGLTLNKSHIGTAGVGVVTVTSGGINATGLGITAATFSGSGSGITGLTNANLSGSAAISNANLANSTISGVALGSNLNALTISTGLSGSSYNGSGAVTIAIDSTVATLTETQTLTNKTLTSPTITGTAACAAITASSSLTVSGNASVSGVSTFTGAVGFSSSVTITGDLTVNGTTTTINSTTISVDDKNIELGSTTSPSDAAADGGGITLKGTTDKTLNWVDATDSWTSSENVNLLTGKTYKINATDVLSATTLGSGVVNSSLTSVGTLTNLVVSGGVNVTGVVTATDFNSTSDRNLKDNIRTIENASELVGKLEGVHFTWKSSGAETCGVVAQQIEEHLPQLVQTGETHKTVNYNGLVGVLIAAVREQGEMIAALKAEIEELKK